MRAVTRRQPLYLLAAIGGHAVVDAWAVWAGSTWGILAVEAGLLVFAGLSIGPDRGAARGARAGAVHRGSGGGAHADCCKLCTRVNCRPRSWHAVADESQYERPA